MNVVATSIMAGRSGGLPADWWWRRKAALVVFALMMTYLHSLYILFFYVTDWDYWWPFWTGMTVEQRLLSYTLALFANVGLMAMPFVRAPGRLIRPLLAASLGWGRSSAPRGCYATFGSWGCRSWGLFPCPKELSSS